MKLVFAASQLRTLKEKEQRKHIFVSEWNDTSTHGLLFQWASTLKIQLKMLI